MRQISLLIGVVCCCLEAFAHSAYVPPEVILVPLAAPVAIGACGYDGNDERMKQREVKYNFFAREGMAFSRVLTSPLNLLLPLYGMPQGYKTAAEMSGFESFVASPGLLVISALYGASGAFDEVCVGAFEILTSLQVRRVYYPWESFTVSRDAVVNQIRKGREKAKEKKDDGKERK